MKKQNVKTIKWKTFIYHPKGKLKNQVVEHLANEKKMKEDRMRHLKEVTIYLEGLFKGQGNILPLGEVHLKSLWKIYGERFAGMRSGEDNGTN